MKRDIVKSLLQWKEQENRSPLLIRGARQVGKTFVIENFGKEYFENILTINFELQPDLVRCFHSLEPDEIIKNLSLLLKQKIEPRKTLLFFDEIQDCPNAIRSLRYFKEKMPNLHVIGAGSLLEFTLNDANLRMPVGRVQSIYLKPFSFKEFLVAAGHENLRTYLEKITIDQKIEEAIHFKLIQLVRQFMILGGMPAVLKEYFSSQSLHQCKIIQSGLLNTYRYDFSKYASKTEHKYLQKLFEKTPLLIATHFKYSKVDSEMRSRDIKKALEMLRYAGLVSPVYATSASGIPLHALINEKKFKIIFLDVGLVLCAHKFDVDILFEEDILLVNRGAIAEQFVGQELIANSSNFEESSLYFWCREQHSSTAEVDYIMTVGSKIIPLEVKAGATGQLKSLKIFMNEKNSRLGIRISQTPLGIKDNILSLPLYMIGELKRLVK